MNSPFKYGQLVYGDTFTNREKELERLRNNFTSGNNTILISPRKWGKSSLVKKAAGIIEEEDRNYKFVFIDLMRVIDEAGFYSTYAKEVIKATSGKADEIFQSIKQFLGKITPRFSFGNDPLNDLEMNFEFRKTGKEFEEVLELPENIAKAKKIKIIICIDEFQELENFSNALLFQKRMRSVIQHHQNVSYCFYGSKKDMMANLFSKRNMPFYKFGDLLFLPKITGEDLSSFIVERFRKSGKTITKEYADTITSMMNCHPHYVQQLAHLVWMNTLNDVNDEIYSTAIEDLLNQNILFFERELESLTASQIRFLKAICDGVTEGFTKYKFISKYELNSSANVLRVKKSLINKQIIDIENSVITFADPAFEYWFKTKYM